MHPIKLALAIQTILATDSVCFYTWEEATSNGYKPGMATSYNKHNIMARMKECGIERAIVTGWDNQEKLMIIHSNGIVVPDEFMNLPSHQMYVRDNGDDEESIVFIERNYEPLKPMVVNPEVVTRPLPEPVSLSTQPIVIQPSPVKLEPETTNKPVEVKEPCKFQSIDGQNVSEKMLDPWEKVSRKFNVMETSVKEYINLSSKEYKFLLGNKSYNGAPMRIEKTSNKSSVITACVINENSHHPINILNKPTILLSRSKAITKELGSNIFGMYVDDESEVYAFYKGVLYRVRVRGHGGVDLVPLSTRDKANSIKRGLYLVTFYQ